MSRRLPSGTVTLLFTDIEGSTKLLHELGAEGYSHALAEHRRILREAFARHGGVEVDTQGDAFFVAFATAPGALAAAAEAQEALAPGPIRVRMGVHTGTPHLSEEGYVGPDVHKGARIAASGHGGQVVLSRESRLLVGEAFSLTDLGEHLVKDFAEPVWIFQLGEEPFPPLKTISNTNLPHSASSFVGRDKEVGEVVSLVRDGGRLLTLTGTGGTGKTRLSIEAASEVVPEFKAGVFWVPLAPLRDPSLVPETIGQVLGAKDGLVEHIGEREMLLVLDNFEQVVGAAPDLASLLEACPNLKVLVTSRELLRVRGEVEYSVPPLADPEAVELFFTRSRLEPDEAVSELCRRLDNLPLAIELAAARTSVLTPAQILDRISHSLDLLKGGRDAEARQQTLRATIEWSHDLLDEDEKRLFGYLSVFAGGCTLEAAEQVTDADLDVLQSLVEKSLLRRTDQRFWMLETIREFAAEWLKASGEAETIRDRHLDHFIAFAERTYGQQLSSPSASLGAELDNFRAALDWASTVDPRKETQLVGAVAPNWWGLGYLPEARDRLAAAVARYAPRDRVRARALMHLGEATDELSTLEEALVLWRELGDGPGEAAALEAIGWERDDAGDYEAAQRAYEESLAVRRRVGGGGEFEEWMTLAGLCHLLVARAEIERAEVTARELEQLGANYESARARELALHFLADCPLVGGDYPEAERRYLAALAYARTSGLVNRSPDELLGVAMSLAGQGDHVRAIRLASAAYGQQERLGLGNDRWWSMMQERLIGAARAALGADVAELERAGRRVTFDAVLDEVLGTEAGAAPSPAGS